MDKNKKESVLITVKVDKKVKEEVSNILEQLGTNTSNVISMLLHQIALKKEIPFHVSLTKNSSSKAKKRL